MVTANTILKNFFTLFQGDEKPLTRERKYVGRHHHYEAALKILQKHCPPDPKYPANWIESIYFDDELSSAYWEKVHGDAFKRKYRIRWYPDLSAPAPRKIQAFLEIKDRIHAARSKLHLGFYTDGKLLQDGDLDDPHFSDLLHEQLLAAGLPPRIDLQPSISIRYFRYRFICPNTETRICLDCNLSAPRINSRRLPPGIPLTSSLIVCEAKSTDTEIWSWSETLYRLGFRFRSFSKYGEFMEPVLNRGF